MALQFSDTYDCSDADSVAFEWVWYVVAYTNPVSNLYSLSHTDFVPNLYTHPANAHDDTLADSDQNADANLYLYPDANADAYCHADHCIHRNAEHRKIMENHGHISRSAASGLASDPTRGGRGF